MKTTKNKTSQKECKMGEIRLLQSVYWEGKLQIYFICSETGLYIFIRKQ